MAGVQARVGVPAMIGLLMIVSVGAGCSSGTSGAGDAAGTTTTALPPIASSTTVVSTTTTTQIATTTTVPPPPTTTTTVPRPVCEVSPPTTDELAAVALAAAQAPVSDLVISEGRCDGDWYFTNMIEGTNAPGFAAFHHGPDGWTAHSLGYSFTAYCVSLEGQPGAEREFEAAKCGPNVQNYHDLGG